jgi:predicted nucleic acid-binding protein
VNRPLVLDTRALSALLDPKKPDHPSAAHVLATLLAARARGEIEPDQPLFSVPALVVYEARRGLLKRDNRRLLTHLERFLRTQSRVVPFDQRTAELAASLWVARSREGRPAGELDLLILATAVTIGADVVTADDGFPTAEGVTLWRWPDLAEAMIER